jgi:hypothetical protein
MAAHQVPALTRLGRDISGLFRSTVLNPHTATGVVGGVPDNLSVMTFPDTSTGRLGGLCAGLKLIEAAQRKTVWDADEAATYILTLAEMMTPGTINTLSQGQHLTITTVRGGRDLAHFTDSAWAPSGTPAPARTVDDRDLSAVVMGLLGEFDDGTPFTIVPTAGTGDITPEVAGGRWGIEMYPIGKSPRDDNLPGFRVNRPRAIIGRFKLDENQAQYFQGAYAPTLPVLRAVESAFDIHLHLRRALASKWINEIGLGGGRVARAFGVTFQLTDGAGFNGPVAIGQLLTAYPSLRGYPLLADEVARADHLVDEFFTLDPQRRGFLKVLYGPTFAHFKDINRGPLMAVAVAFKSTKQGTFRRFMDISQYEGFIHRLNRWLEARGEPTITVFETEEAIQQVV